ncbi:Dolichyl-phosphate beta-glucosyltransferase, partial [Trichoplax sp. H2]
VYIFLLMSTNRAPNLTRTENENYFYDPNTDTRHRFPTISDPASVDVTIVVPSYNEEKRLPVMLDETIEYFRKRKQKNRSFSYEIIVVDDGSKDRTTQVALEYVKGSGTDSIRVLTLDYNRGKGGAIRIGALSSRGRYILMVDADGATKFEDIEKLEHAAMKLNKDYSKDCPIVVAGSRAHLEEESMAERTIFRTFLMHGFHLLVRFLCVKGVKDTQCGFKLFNRVAADILFHSMHVNGWAFDVELLYIAETLRMPIAEVGVNWTEIEGSKMTPFLSWAQMGRDLIIIRLNYLFGLWKIDKTKHK